MLREWLRVAAMALGLFLAGVGIASVVADHDAAAVVIAAVYVLLGGGVYLSLTEAPLATAFRRWLLWNVRCQRGRRCANMTFIGPPEGIDIADVPPGSVVHMDYACGACGTAYHTSAILNGDTFTQTDRVRLR